MADQPGNRFSFVSNAVSPDTFSVVRFRGEEGLSCCYRFEVELASAEAALDLKAVLRNPATFTIRRPEGDIPFHGYPAEFRQLHQAGAYTFYKAVLVPRLWWLSLTHHNQVFLNQSPPDILTACLGDVGLSSSDYSTRIQHVHPHWEYVCQYRESHLNFLSRGLEWGGIYYYFEQGSSSEKVIFTDTKVAHEPMPQGDTLRYRALAAMETFHREEVIWGLECRQHLLPKSLLLKDFNSDTPSLELFAQAPVSPEGRGERYLYGEHFMSPEEGDFVAKRRAEELLCREQEFTGESAIPFLRPGYTFDMQDHYRDDFNRRYLTTRLVHEGSQAAYLLAGLGVPLAPGEEEPFYRNRFTAIPDSVQFRPERKSKKPRFYGLLNAKIDAAGSGQYAELDELGRYKVILPFDLSGRKDGKASAWIRMMTPYAGSDHGMHFPLHKGTEVLLAFIDGDPNRPVIAGAVPNPATPSPVTGDNQTMSILQTSGKNRIAIEDKEGSQRILLQTPVADSWIRLGAPNDPPPMAGDRPTPPTPTPTPSESGTEPTETEDDGGGGEEGKEGIYVYTNGPLKCVGASADVQILGEKCEFVLGANQVIIVGNEAYIKLLTNIDVTLGLSLEWKMGRTLGVGKHSEYKFSHQGFHLEKVDLEGEVTRMTGEINHMRGVETKLIGSMSNLSGQTSVLAGSVSRLSGTVSNLSTNVDQLAVATTALTGEVSSIHGVQTEEIGEALQMVAQNTALVTAQTNVIATSTNSIAEKTDLHAENTVLSGLQTLI